MSPSVRLLLPLIALGASCTLAWGSPLAFEQVHIALAGRNKSSGTPSGMSVSWFTLNTSSAPSVKYGTSSGNLDKIATGKTKVYLSGHGYHHHAVLNSIPEGSVQIFYKVGDSTANVWDSDERSFRTAKTRNQPFSMSIFGDMGFEDSKQRRVVLPGLEKDWSATYSRQTLENLKDQKLIDLVWHVGDIGYADDAFGEKPLSFQYEKIYNGYMNWIENITATMPYMVSVGNHESECHSPACIVQNKKYAQPLRNFSAYNARWRMPSQESSGSRDTNMWYSWNYGDVHFVSLDTETDFPGAEESKTGDSHFPWLPAGGFGVEGEYMAWLEADLAAADAARKSGDPSGRKWLIAGGHRPYGDVKDCCEALFEKYGVDMYFAGHGHSYARSMPASKARVELNHDKHLYQKPNGTVWIMVGGAGCDEMKEGDEPDSQIVSAPDGSTVVTSDRYATGVLSVNSTALYWRLIDSKTGSVLDELSIV